MIAMLAPPLHRLLLMRHVAEGGARGAAALRALFRCVDLVSARPSLNPSPSPSPNQANPEPQAQAQPRTPTPTPIGTQTR